MKKFIFVALLDNAGNRKVVTTEHPMHRVLLPMRLAGAPDARALIGPFRTMRGARFMAQKGCQCETVAQAEAAAKRET